MCTVILTYFLCYIIIFILQFGSLINCFLTLAPQIWWTQVERGRALRSRSAIHARMVGTQGRVLSEILSALIIRGSGVKDFKMIIIVINTYSWMQKRIPNRQSMVAIYGSNRYHFQFELRLFLLFCQCFRKEENIRHTKLVIMRKQYFMMDTCKIRTIHSPIRSHVFFHKLLIKYFINI